MAARCSRHAVPTGVLVLLLLPEYSRTRCPRLNSRAAGDKHSVRKLGVGGWSWRLKLEWCEKKILLGWLELELVAKVL